MEGGGCRLAGVGGMNKYFRTNQPMYRSFHNYLLQRSSSSIHPTLHRDRQPTNAKLVQYLYTPALPAL